MKMSKDLLSMGSKSKPPVLQIGEYPQWRVRMIQFLNNIDKTLMVSTQEGPIKPYIDIPAKLDDKALTFLTMAIPNDLFNRVDSRNTAKELWDELEKQFQGTKRSIQAKLNQAIGAYEGFKALEGETLADSYKWDHYPVNLQMNKNLAEEDLDDLYSILSQHEVKVKDIVTKQKSITDSLALLTEKNKSVLSTASSKKKSHSKALVTELSDSDSDTVEDDSSESDVDLKRVADKLALLSSSIHKRYGNKKFYSKPKFENYKRDKYKPKKYEKRPERKTYEKGKTDEKGNAQLAKRKSEGKVLMAEEECWYDDTSDDEDFAHFTQVHYNLMASVEEIINLHKETEETNEVSQTPSDSDLSDNDECSLEEQFLILKTEFDDLKEKIKFERARVIEFSNECELYKCLADDRELEKAEIRKEKAKLESQISEMKSALVNLESEKAEYMIKYEVCFLDRSEDYAKIKQLEDLNIKRGQTQQTLKLLTNNLKDTRFYNPKMGLGLPEVDVLKKAPKGLYQFDNLTFPKLNETFVKSGSSLSDSSDKGKEKVVDDSSDSFSDSKPKRKNNFDFTCDFQYDELNQSYKTRKPEFSYTQCVSLYSQDVKSFSNESEKLSNNIENESKTTESTPKSEDKTSELENETDCENLSELIQVNNLSENKSVSDYESESDSDETKPCFDSDNDDDIEAGVEEEKINFISNPMFESQDTPSCFNQRIKPEVTDLITYAVIDKDGYLVYKTLDSMVEVPKTPINSSSSDSTDLKSFKRHGLGWMKKDSKKKKHFATNESFVKKSFDDANKCNLNVRFNKCQNSFESALMFFAMQRLHCTHCGDNSFSLNSRDVKKKRSSGVSHDKSRAYSFDHRAKVFSVKKKNLSKAKDKSVDVKFVCKWIPKDLLNARISKSGINYKILGSSSDLLKMHMWYVDSGCSRHMTGYKELLHNFVERPGGTVTFGNKTTGVIKGYDILTNGKVSIKKVLYVEGLSHNLFSASQFCDGYNIGIFSIINCLIINSDSVQIFEGRRFYNLYVVDFPVIDSSKPVCLFTKATKGESWLWHRRFSHQNFSDISKLANGGLVKGLPKLTFDRDSLCPACQMGKMKRSSHKSKIESSCQSPLEMIHMDLCGPIRIQSISGKKYILVMVDEYSWYTWLEFLRMKSEAPELIIKFIKRIQVLLQLPVRKIRSDNGTEFKNATLDAYLTSVVILGGGLATLSCGASSGVTPASFPETQSHKVNHRKHPLIVSASFGIGSAFGDQVFVIRCAFVRIDPQQWYQSHFLKPADQAVLGVNGGGVSRNRKPHHSNVVTAIDRYSNHRSAVVAIATAVDGGGGLVVLAGKLTAVVAVAAAVVDDFRGVGHDQKPTGGGGGSRAAAVAGDPRKSNGVRAGIGGDDFGRCHQCRISNRFVFRLFFVNGSRVRSVSGKMSPISIPFYSPEESLRLITGKWKLTGQNFPVWKLHLQNVLSAQGKLYVINKPMSRPKSNAPEEEFAEYFRFMVDESDVMSILVFSMSPEFTGDLRVKFCHEVVRSVENQLGFYKHTGKLLIMQEILSLKLQKGQSVKNHLIDMRRLFKCLSRLGYKMTQEELVYLMWFSLTKEVQDTASAYMKEPKNDVDKVHEDILASLEPVPEPANLMDTDIIDELGDLSCPECGSEDICEHSMNIDQMDIGLPDAPGIFMIDCLITSYESWVINTGSGNHICNHLQGFTRRKTLRKDRSNLRVGEGTPLIAEAVGSYSLSLPSGLVLELDNCYYIPNMIKNVLSFDLLVDQGFYYKYSYKMCESDNRQECNVMDQAIRYASNMKNTTIRQSI
ncbi:hypothetical protein OSB04_002699 [Centaurea solstitialis]|uniref:Integrase catalytic domain-containing protein n=1 Tax=Centaurea solstitialis TaxID=347529 RepID=A0AA38U0Z5_9ASTR|nr:hypothetical protein OSB04_002699 [Centaurea solstitialis]